MRKTHKNKGIAFLAAAVSKGAVVGCLLAAAAPASAQAPGFAQTCAYFDSVSFNDRHTLTTETLNMRLANDCVAALALLDSPPDTEAHRRGLTYLTQIEAYRAVLIDMARSRFNARSTAGTGPHATRVTRPVSRTGAYLIAANMGLLTSQGDFRDWTLAQAD